MSLPEALLKWLSLANHQDSDLTALQVSDGITMSQVLHKIDPKHFTQLDWCSSTCQLVSGAGGPVQADRLERRSCKDWMSKLKSDISDNKRLKANNLRKIVNSITDYTNDVIGLQLVDFTMPDTNRAAEGNIQDVGRIIQLILGCAVNCDRKQEYIESMMSMDSSAQELIMQAIQEILNLPPVSDPSLPLLSASEIRRVMEDLEDANAEKDQLMQKCHNLEIQVNLLQDEKNNINSEFELLQKELIGKGDIASMKYDRNSDLRQKEMLKMLESAQEVEKERDDLQLKVELLERQMEEMGNRETDLQKIADQARALKDEVDILRDASDKVVKYEATIDSYKKKMEELSSLKRQLKLLEDNNTTLLQANLALENDVKKTGNWKPQVDVFKKQISEYHSKLETETKRADKLEFETKKLLEKLEAVKVEKDRLQTERDELRETTNELHDQIKIGNNSRFGGSKLDDQEDDFGMAMIPLEVKEKLFRLKNENKKLKEQINLESSGGHNEVLQTLVDDLTEREARLESNNRKLNQKILELESKLEEARGAQNFVAPRVPGSREELELKLAEANKKVSQLQDNVHKKEVEMQAMEERYKKYIEKAKSVIKTLDPKQNPNAVPEVSALRKQLTDKDVLIETLEQETEKARAVREMEERLMSSAFYNLSMQMHRATVENRLSNVHSSSPQQQGQSFLARQRQVQNSVGRSNQSNPSAGAKNPGYSDFLDY